MTIESALAKAIEGGDHPGLFSETESYTSPRVVARNELIRLFTQDHLKEALRRYRELRAEQPKVIDEDLTRVLGRYLGNHGRLDPRSRSARRTPKIILSQRGLRTH